MLFQKIVTNFTGVVRNDTMEGRDYLVAPMIMLLEGVHEGSGGPLLYPADELAKTPVMWNHKPVVVYHPQANGQGVSACDPLILSNRKVGVIMNTTYKDGKLKAEAWLEKDRMDKVDNRISEAIEKNETMELSTGLFTENEKVEGEWNGEHYDQIARNYRPDHLALLPDIKGACSVEDGAGFLRLNAEKKEVSVSFDSIDSETVRDYLQVNKNDIINRMNSTLSNFITNEMSFDNVRTLLNSLLQVNGNELWIEDIYDTFFVYDDKGTLYKQGYKIEDSSASFIGNKEEVKRVTEYRTKEGSFVGNNIVNNRKEITMNKKELVDGLIANTKTKWVEADRELLMAMNEDTLEKAEPVAEAETPAKAPAAAETKVSETASTEEVAADAAAAEASDAPAENMSAEDYIANKVPNELKGVLRSGLASYNADKAQMVGIITANKKNAFTKEQLEVKELPELKNLAALASDTKVQKQQVLNLDYSGQGDPIVNEVNAEVPMDLPTMNYDEAVK